MSGHPAPICPAFSRTWSSCFLFLLPNIFTSKPMIITMLLIMLFLHCQGISEPAICCPAAHVVDVPVGSWVVQLMIWYYAEGCGDVCFDAMAGAVDCSSTDHFRAGFHYLYDFCTLLIELQVESFGIGSRSAGLGREHAKDEMTSTSRRGAWKKKQRACVIAASAWEAGLRFELRGPETDLKRNPEPPTTRKRGSHFP